MSSMVARSLLPLVSVNASIDALRGKFDRDQGVFPSAPSVMGW